MLNLYDIIVSSIIMTCFFTGLHKGGVRLILGNISFVFSILLSFLLYPASQTAVSEYIESDAIINTLAGCISYIISLILCSVFFSKIKLIIKPMCGGLIDKSVGSMLGVFNGLFLSLLFFLVVAFFSSPKSMDHHDDLYNLISATKHDNYPKWLKDSTSFGFISKLLAYGLQYPCIVSILKQTDLDFSLKSQKESQENGRKMDPNLELELDKLLDDD